MEVRTFKYELIDSNMYIMIESYRALIIDPCISDSAMEYMRRHVVNDITVILTHEHWDHITGVNWLRSEFKSCTVMCSETCARNTRSTLWNGSKYLQVLFIDQPAEKSEKAERIEPFTCSADLTFSGDSEMTWGKHHLSIRGTPGHSPGSICILLDDESVFTGDSLLKDTPVITRLPGGSQKEYEEKTRPFLRSLSKDMYVYPGHGDSGFMRDFHTA